MRGRNTRPGKQFTQVFYIIAIQHIAVVRMVKKSLYLIQRNAKARAMGGFDLSPQVMQQGLHLAPMNIAANRVVENRAKQIRVLVAHVRFISSNEIRIGQFKGSGWALS